MIDDSPKPPDYDTTEATAILAGARLALVPEEYAEALRLAFAALSRALLDAASDAGFSVEGQFPPCIHSPRGYDARLRLDSDEGVTLEIWHQGSGRREDEVHVDGIRFDPRVRGFVGPDQRDALALVAEALASALESNR